MFIFYVSMLFIFLEHLANVLGYSVHCILWTYLSNWRNLHCLFKLGTWYCHTLIYSNVPALVHMVMSLCLLIMIVMKLGLSLMSGQWLGDSYVSFSNLCNLFKNILMHIYISPSYFTLMASLLRPQHLLWNSVAELIVTKYLHKEIALIIWILSL